MKERERIFQGSLCFIIKKNFFLPIGRLKIISSSYNHFYLSIPSVIKHFVQGEAFVFVLLCIFFYCHLLFHLVLCVDWTFCLIVAVDFFNDENFKRSRRNNVMHHHIPPPRLNKHLPCLLHQSFPLGFHDIPDIITLTLRSFDIYISKK